MTSGLVRLSRDDGHARLTLARPERTNSLDAEMLNALVLLLGELSDDPPRALVLAGEGNHFSTGGDVSRFAAEVEAGNGAAYAEATVSALHRAILALLALPCPVIAQLKGATTGGSLGLSLAADLVVMRETAFLQPYYGVVGFGPDGGWTALLPDRIGAAKALEIQFLNRRIGAREAQDLGLASAVAGSDEELAAITRDWLATIDAHVAGTLTATRALVWDDARREAVSARLDAERAVFIERVDAQETRDGMATFLSGPRGTKTS